MTKFSIALIRLVAVFNIAAALPAADWRQTVEERLPHYGHRNWIVIADSAYPEQSRPGIETIVANADQLNAVRTVLEDLAKAKHIRPIVYTDRELTFVPESDAPGVTAYRKDLGELLHGKTVQTRSHDEIISLLDAAGQTFRVLVIKTTMTIPYTSVFLQLDCAYWSADAEKRLRAAMAK